MNWNDLTPQLKARLIRENPQDINSHGIIKNTPKPVGGLRNTLHEPDPLPPLDQGKTARRGRKKSVVIVVTITRYGTRLLDGDNYQGGAKSLRDAIARSLALDDGDKRIVWEYAQVVTKGRRGTHVSIACS